MNTRQTTKSSKKGHSGRLLWRPLSLFSIFIFAVITAAPSLMAASGDFSIDFVAASPESYNHLTGGGAYDDRTVGVGNDIVESLEGGDFACGDIVTYFAAVTVDNTQTAINDGPQTIEMDFSFLMDTTGQSGVAIGDIVYVGVNYGTIEDLIAGENSVDDGIVDDGGSVATLIDEYTTGPLFTAGSELWGTVELTDLEASEQVVVRIDVKLFCDPGSNPTGNLQAALQAARLTFINNTTPVDPPQAIPGGAQTIPFKQFGNIQTPDLAIAKTVTTAGGTCPGLETLTVTAGDMVKYCYVVSNPGTAPLYNVALTDDNGTPGDPGDDFPVSLVGLIDVDNDGFADDLAAGDFATGEALVTLATAGTVVNTGTATGVDSILFPTEYIASDIATVIVEPPPVEAPQTRVVKGNAEGNDTVATLNEPGGSVTIDVVVYNDAPTPTGDATLTSLVDDIYGNITNAGHDDITATSCATGGVIPGGGSYSCSFTVDITSEPGTITDTVTATLTNDATAVSDDDQANVVINDVVPTVTLVKSASPTTLPEPGGDFLFTLDITNTSAETVTITDLIDTQSAATDFSACATLIGTTLAPGASTSCQYTVSHADVGSYDNTASVTVEDNDGSTASDSDSETVTVTDVLPTVDLTKEASPLSQDEPGGDFLFTLTIVNTSVEEVTITELSDNQSAEAVDFSACSSLVGTTLAAGASTSCQYTVNHTTPGSYDNTASVTVADNEANTASDSDSATVVVNDVPSAISMVKTAVPTEVTEPGGDVTYTFTVSNDSAVDSVTIDTLTDTVYGDLDGQGTCSVPQTIAPGGSYACSFTTFVSSSETNVATASGVDDDGNSVSANDDASVTVNDSFTNIVVTKTAVPTSVNEPGGDVTFSVTIANPSTVDSVTINSLVDDIHGDLNGQGDCAVPQTIAIGGSYSCSFTAVVSGNAGDSETDTVTASGVDEDGVPVSDDDSATVTVEDVQPAISVDKTADPTSVDEPGGDVTFTVVVNNDSVGSDPVTITSLTDDVHGDLNGQGGCAVPQTIAAGGSYTCSFTATVSGNAGDSETDVVTASGADDEGNPVSANDDATVTVNDVPSSILTTKTASPTTVPETGGDVTFTISVENTSAVDDVTINSVVDSEFGDVSASCTPALPATLAPSESLTCTFTEFISGDYPNSHTNVVTATGQDDDGNPVEDDDEEDVLFEDVLPDITVIKSASPSSVPETGGFVTFTFVATNNSLEAVSLDSMVDDTFGDLNGQGSCTLPQALGPAGDESASYTCFITVFLAADDLAPHTNVVTATASDDDGNPATDTDDETVTFTDVAPEILLTKSASPSSVPETGGDVTFTFTVENIGQEDVTLTSLTDTIFNDLNGQGDCAVPQTILIGDSYSCSITALLSADDLVDHYNVSTAVAVDDDNTEDSDDDDETVTFEDLLPDVSITKTANPTSVPETGENVEFTIVVTNNSLENATIDSLVDSDFDLTAHCPDAVGTVLAFGESYTCVFTEYLTGDDLVAHENTATVTTSDNDGNSDTASDDETVTFTDVAPQIQITKSANPGSVPETGDDVTFTFLVENIGQEDVTLTSLTDTVFGDLNGQGDCVTGGLIPIGGSYSCSITVNLSADDLADHYNVATAVGMDDDGTTDDDTDDETVTFEDVAPIIQITKTASPSSVLETGGDVTFTFLVENIGQEDVTLTSLSDTIFGDLNGQGDCATGGLIPIGGSYSCSITVFLSADDLADHYNVATAVGTDDDGTSDEDSDDETVTFEDVAPVIQITKSASPTSVPETGGDVTFTFLVENIGEEDVTLTSLSDTVFGDLNGQGDCVTGGLIPIGGSYSCSITVNLSADDLAPHTNVATATAVDDDGTGAEDSDDETVTFTDVAPQIELIKGASPSTVPETGGDVTFTFTVNNIGQEDVTLTSLTDTVFGDLNGQGDCVTGGLIPIGGSYSCSITVNLSADDLADHYNVATAVGTDDDGTSDDDTDDETVTFEDVAPVIQITKSANPTSVPETGGDVTFTFLVENIGQEDVTLTSLTDTVFGDLNGQGDCVTGGLIPIGGSYSCSITVNLSADDLADHYNVATATAVDDDGTTDDDTDDETVLFDDVLPDVSITKTANPTSVPEPGDNVEFTIIVTNNSLEDATIDSLVDSDFDLAANCTDAVGTVLASGASYTCTFTEFVAGNVGQDHQNTATVVASDNDGNADTESDDADVIITNVTPVINIVKDGEATINEGGDTATYSFTITNNSVSTDPLTITSLTDDQFGDLLAEAEAANGGNPIVLNPSDSFSFSIDRDLTLNVGETHTNVVTVVGTDDEGDTATDDDDHIVGVDNVAPAIEIIKDGEATINEGGDTATYEFTITNNSVSTDPLTITSLVDDQFGDLLPEAEAANSGNPIILAPGAGFSFEIDRDLTLNAGDTHINVVTVVGVDDEGTEATDNDDHTVGANDVEPMINIDKDGEATINEGGDTATYSFTITNNSVSTDPLTITSLTDDQFGDLLAEAEAANGGNPIVLNPGDNFSFSIDRDLTLNVGETHTNVVTVVGTDDEGDTATDNDDHTVGADNVAPAIEIVKDGEATINEGGDTATYSFLITNNSVSTDPLTVTSLTDDKFGDLLAEAEAANSGNPIVLNPGDSFSFSIDRDLTLNVGETHTNVVTVVGTDDEGDTATDDDDHTVGADNVAPVINIVKSGEATINEGGDTATYEITITNNSVSTDPLTITSLVDNQFGDLLPEAEAAWVGQGNIAPIVLQPGQAISFEFDRGLTLNAGETHTNVVDVVGTDDEDETVTDDDDHVVTADNVAPVINIEKDGDATIDEGGDTATYNFLITNNSVSTDPLTITSLLDDQFGNLLPEAEAANGGTAIVLNPGESFSFSINRDLILDAGETHTNRVTVLAIDDEGDEAADDDDHVVEAVNVTPIIDVTKTPNQDQVFAPGEAVVFTIRVENNSVVTDPVTITSLIDDVFGDVSAECILPQTIGVGGAFECDITRTISGDHINTVTATAVDDEGTEVSDSATADVEMINPSVAIEKATNGFDADAAPGPEILVGSAVNWTYVVTNDGDVAIENISVSDDQGVVVTCPQATLAVGESMTCTASGISVVDQYTNLGTVNATHTDVDGDTANRSDSDPSHYYGAAPSVVIVKTFAFDSVIAGGAGSSFTLVVTNDGNVALDDVAVFDDVDDRLMITGVSGTAGVDNDSDADAQTVEWLIASLDVGESVTVTVNFTVASDVEEANGDGGLNNAPSVSNTATVSDTYTDDSSNSTDISDEDSDTIDILVDINLSIVKTFDPAEAPQGTFQSFTIEVSNAGPSDAVDVSVTDSVHSSLEVTGVSVTSGTGNCSASGGQEVACTVQIPAGESVTITVDYFTAPFLDDDPSPYGTLGGDDFRFVFVNGSVLEGSTAGGPVYLDGMDITDQVTILTSLTRNDLIFDPPGDDPAFEMHLSCSDPFSGGWGQSAGPVEGVDVNWQIAFFSIARYNNNGFIKNCGNVVNPFDVPNTATATGDDSFGTETVSADATLTIVPGITIDRLQTKGKRLTVRLTNFTGEDKEIADVSAVWPNGNGDMIKVWLTQDGTSWVIWDGAAAPTEALLDSSVEGWNGATLLTGEGILRFDFQNKSADSGYVIRVNFTDGTFLDISVGTSSSITSTGSSSSGNGNGNN